MCEFRPSDLILTRPYLLSSLHISHTFPLGYFTVREVLHIVLHRYTSKNSKKAARLVGDHVFYEGAVGMNFGWGGWGS